MDQSLTSLIRDIPDFPVPGILFRDITTLLKEGPAFKSTITQLCAKLRELKPDKVVAIESRGLSLARLSHMSLGSASSRYASWGSSPPRRSARNMTSNTALTL